MSARSSRGFTLIELTLVLTIFGVLGVMTIPHYLDSKEQSLAQSKWDRSGEVKALHRELASAQQNDFPTVTGLAGHLNTTELSDEITAQPGGISLHIDGDEYLLPTYRNTRCTERTLSVDDKVGCVGTISG